MALKFTAFLWPPLVFPIAQFIGGGKYALSTPGARPPMIFPLPIFIGGGKYALATPGPRPPMIFPLPTATGKIGGTFVPSAWPPMHLPLPLAARTAKVATPAPPPMPSMVAPASTTRAQSWTPAAGTVSLVAQAKHVDPYVTQDATNKFFGIVAPRPGSGT